MKVNILLDIEDKEWIVVGLDENELYFSSSLKDCFKYAKRNQHDVCDVDCLYVTKGYSTNTFLLCKSKTVTKAQDLDKTRKNQEIIKRLSYKKGDIKVVQRYFAIQFKCEIDIVESFSVVDTKKSKNKAKRNIFKKS